MIAITPYSAADRSPTDTPHRTGSPPALPVILIVPPSACATMSYAGAAAFGPVCPKPEIEHKIIRGFAALSCAYPTLKRAIVPGEKFSTTTSDFAASSSRIAAPSALRKSIVILRLPRLTL